MGDKTGESVFLFAEGLLWLNKTARDPFFCHPKPLKTSADLKQTQAKARTDGSLHAPAQKPPARSAARAQSAQKPASSACRGRGLRGKGRVAPAPGDREAKRAARRERATSAPCNTTHHATARPTPLPPASENKKSGGAPKCPSAQSHAAKAEEGLRRWNRPASS